jgi:hypothetical protein
MPKLNELTGQRFGRLLVRERAGTNSSKKPTWECKCDCGNVKVVVGAELIKGTTQSCGCLRKELLAKRSETHGMRKTRIYNIWYAMKRRCQEEKNISYPNYGGRGISVCDGWQDFINFKADMYDSYSKHVEKHGENQTTLDRIDCDGDYTPENTRWATYTIQSRNSRVRQDNKTGYRGVFRKDGNGGYIAYIKVNKEPVNLGTYENIEDAVSARRNAELQYWEEI